MVESSIDEDIKRLKNAKIGEIVKIPLREYSHDKTKQILEGMPDRVKETKEWKELMKSYKS